MAMGSYQDSDKVSGFDVNSQIYQLVGSAVLLCLFGLQHAFVS
ncbi:hypothetical protein Tco_1224830, partial [Tanacetum coccineum]